MHILLLLLCIFTLVMSSSRLEMNSRSSASQIKKGVCNLEAKCVGHASAASSLSCLEVQFVDQLL